MAKSFTLGRGLESLISSQPKKEGSVSSSQGEYQLRMIDIDFIDPNPFQPRAEFEEEALKELADSIREFGVLQPLTVISHNGRYRLLAGERRLRASKIAGLTQVPVVIRPYLADDHLLSLAIVENVQRKDLNPIEEAHAYQQLIDEFNYTQERVAQSVGKPRATIANTLRLLQLPAKAQAALAEGKISPGHAKALLSVTDIRSQLILLDRILDEHLTVRQTEAAARPIEVKSHVRHTQKNFPQDVFLQNVSRVLGTKVELRGNKNKGSLVIYFYSSEEWENLKKKLNSIS
jgi:ParB family chromosome partitioning protein